MQFPTWWCISAKVVPWVSWWVDSRILAFGGLIRGSKYVFPCPSVSLWWAAGSILGPIKLPQWQCWSSLSVANVPNVPSMVHGEEGLLGSGQYCSGSRFGTTASGETAGIRLSSLCKPYSWGKALWTLIGALRLARGWAAITTTAIAGKELCCYYHLCFLPRPDPPSSLPHLLPILLPLSFPSHSFLLLLIPFLFLSDLLHQTIGATSTSWCTELTA